MSDTRAPTGVDVAVGIPRIDLAPLADGRAGLDAVAAEVAHACESVGFFAITNHGFPSALLEEMYDVTARFFALPEAAKCSGCASPPTIFRGYTGPAHREAGAGGAPPDLVEYFAIGMFDTVDDMLRAGYTTDVAAVEHIANVWPPEPAGMRDVWHRYCGEMHRLCLRLMSVCAAALELPTEWFADKFSRHNSRLFANYYPAQTSPPLEDQLRQGPHTDFGSLSILFQDNDVGGLQVRTRDGGWYDVPHVAGAFVVALGDLLAHWTNDRWIATEHRVVNPPPAQRATERRSLNFFHLPNCDALIEAIPTCVGPDDPPRHPPVVASKWQEYKMATYYDPRDGGGN